MWRVTACRPALLSHDINSIRNISDDTVGAMKESLD